MQDAWSLLARRVTDYKFSPNHSFELLISTRHSGSPQFYRLRSKDRTLVAVGDLCSVGSGKELFDHPLRTFDANRSQTAKVLPVSPADVWLPYAYCHWLTEQSLGFPRELVESKHVGGIFHFIMQRPVDEGRQAPSLFVVCKVKGGRELDVLPSRISFADGAMVYEEHGKTPVITWNTIDFPELRFTKPNSPQFTTFVKGAVRNTRSQPYYFYCGFVFANSEYHGKVAGSIYDGRNYLVDPITG